MTVRLPNSPRDEVSGFDVTGSSDNGTVIVQKLDNVQHKTPAEIETLLRSGHRILAVHIPLAACRFEETVEVLNAVLPFKPEFYVKREPDWLSNLQSLGDYTGHVGIKWMEDGETPKQSSSGQVSYTSTPNPEPAEDDLTNDGMVTPLFDEHLDTHLPQPDDDRDPVAHDYLSATTIAPEPEPAYNSESDEEVEADFVEPAFEHDYFSSVCNAPVFDDEKLCRLAELPATIVEEEEPFDEETEELVRLKKQTFVQSIRGSDRLAKISMRSKDSIRVPQKVLRSPAVLIQKRTELPPKVEAEAEVEVFVSRPVTPIVEVQPPIAASSLQLHASLKVAEAETPRGRAPHKRRFFKKPSMKRGLSAPELPFDVNDQNELYSNLPLDFQSDEQSAQSSVDGRTQASEPVSVSRHRSHSRVRRSASYFADPGEKEVVFPLKYRKHRDSTFVQEPSDTPSRLNIHVLPVDKAIEQKMMENVYESFTPRFLHENRTG